MEIDDKNFNAIHMRWTALTKPYRDKKKELESIIRAIQNEANHGNFKYSRKHMFEANVDYLRAKGFEVIATSDGYEVNWNG